MKPHMKYARYRWFVLAVLCFIQCVAVAHLVAPNTMISHMAESLGMKTGAAGNLAMLYINFFVFGGALLGGAAIDRFGPYLVWIGGLLLLIAASLLYPVLGNTFSGVFLIRAIMGIGCGPIMGTTPLVVAKWFSPDERGVIMGFQGTFVSLGAIASMTLVPRMFERTHNWPIALASVAGIGLLGLLGALVVHAGPKPAPMEAPRPVRHGEGYQKAIRLSATWGVIACLFFFGWAVRIFNDLIPTYLGDPIPRGVGLGVVKAGMIMSGMQIPFSIGGILSGFMMELFFKGRPRGLVMTGFFLCTLFWFMVGVPIVAADTLVLSLCIWGGGFALSVTSPLVYTFISKSYPEEVMGKLGGLSTAAMTIGTIFGFWLATYSLDKTGSFVLPILIAVLGALLGVVSAGFLIRPKGFATEGGKCGFDE